jgi:hypothetical protein
MDIDYLFTYSIKMEGNEVLSDTGSIQNNLLLPYWFWGIIILLISFILIFFSLLFYLKKRINQIYSNKFD